jgi:pre-mRNA-splicing factor CWC22
MTRDINDKASVEYQRLTWDALRKSLNGLINKVSVRICSKSALLSDV